MEDLMVVLGSVDKSLEKGVKEVLNLNVKSLDDIAEIPKHLDLMEPGTWEA